MQSPDSANNNMETENELAKQLASYKLDNKYTFFGTVHIKVLFHWKLYLN